MKAPSIKIVDELSDDDSMHSSSSRYLHSDGSPFDGNLDVDDISVSSGVSFDQLMAFDGDDRINIADKDPFSPDSFAEYAGDMDPNLRKSFKSIDELLNDTGSHLNTDNERSSSANINDTDDMSDADHETILRDLMKRAEATYPNLPNGGGGVFPNLPNDVKPENISPAQSFNTSHPQYSEKDLIMPIDMETDADVDNIARNTSGTTSLQRATNNKPTAIPFDTNEIDQSKTRNTRTAVPLAEQPDRILVPLETVGDGKVDYVTLDKYKVITRKSGEDLKQDLDTKAVLIKTESGTYLPKNQIYRTTFVENPDKSLSKDQIDAKRGENFAKRMDELGLSDKTFAEIKPEKLTAAERKFQPIGAEDLQRSRSFNYEHPVQAGQHSPDIMIRKSDGSFEAKWLKKDVGPQTIADVEDRGNKREDILIKSKGNGYIPIDSYNQRKGPDAGERLVAKLTETTLHNERKDLAPALYKLEEGVYVSGAEYKRNQAKPEYKDRLEGDMNKVESLFQGTNGNSLLTAKALKFADPNDYAKTFEKEGLSPDIKTPMNVTKPAVLVRVNDDVVISGERASMMANGKPLDQVFPTKDIYVQNVGKNGQPTGNYKDVETLDRYNQKDMVNTRLINAGVRQDPAAVKMAEAFAPANLDKTLNAPALQANRYDERSRGVAARSL